MNAVFCVPKGHRFQAVRRSAFTGGPGKLSASNSPKDVVSKPSAGVPLQGSGEALRRSAFTGCPGKPSTGAPLQGSGEALRRSAFTGGPGETFRRKGSPGRPRSSSPPRLRGGVGGGVTSINAADASLIPGAKPFFHTKTAFRTTRNAVFNRSLSAGISESSCPPEPGRAGCPAPRRSAGTDSTAPAGPDRRRSRAGCASQRP